VTLKEIARISGFSINTVSRALNNKDEVKADTREKILAVANKLGYIPNRLARGLRSNKTQTIGVIVADIANPFFAAVVKGVEKAARQRHYSIILTDSDETYEKEEESIQIMLNEQVDGLLISPVQTKKETIIGLKESGFPFVLLGRHFDDLETDYVVTDDVQGGFLATEHLIKQRHSRIALINGPLHVSSAKERFQGYKKALGRYGIELESSLISSGAITTEDGYKVAKSLLKQENPPTAVFAYSDFVAFGVMTAIRENGLRIPEDISIVGYDDVEFSSSLEVPLTTVRISKMELGRKAVKVLNERINNGAAEKTRGVKLVVELMIRRST
jgi:LacI family transcriptional regulator